MPSVGQTAKEMCDRVLEESGFVPGLSYAGATEDTERRVFAALNRMSIELGRVDWPALTTEATISLTTATEYDLPSDFGRFTQSSLWEQGGRREIQLPTGQETWRYLEATTLQSGLTLRGKIIGNKLHLNRSENGETLSFEYISKHLVLATDGTTTKRLFTLDSDTSRTDDECLILGTIALFMRRTGLQDWQLAQRDFMRQLSHEKGTYQGKRKVSIMADSDFSIDPHFDQWVT